MNNFTLTMIDSSGIQNYIFGSNRLQENIGASELVYQATTLWAFNALYECKFRDNVENRTSWNWKLNDREIETDENIDAEIVYAGGGNTLIIFRDKGRAIKFSQNLTRHILEDAPGLTVAVQHVEFDMQQDKLTTKRKELLKKLAAHKQSRLPSSPLLGLGVTAVCESTGLPAARTNNGGIEINGKIHSLKLSSKEETRLISPEIERKLGWRNLSTDRLEDFVGKDIIRFYDFPSKMDDLGRIKGEESYVAVVHADGNKMGKHINKIEKRITDWQNVSKSNRKYIQGLRNFSEAVNTAGINALKTVLSELVKNISRDEKTGEYYVAEKVPMNENKLPFRPLVFGGDDVTFVCNGQLGLSLAAMYLKAFEKETSKLNLPDMYACAGIAIVKNHYPFARAYALSEQLCGSAKKAYRQDDYCSALDWHFAPSGLSSSLGSIRKREYCIRRISDKGEEQEYSLTRRPLRLRRADADQSGRYWEKGVERVIRAFKNGEWEGKRNKVKGLYAALREGPEKTKSYRENFGLPKLPELIPGAAETLENGWLGTECVYFDAIELMDHYVPLTLWEEDSI